MKNHQITEPATAVFLHIPKTAGLTLYGIIDDNYDPASIFTVSGAPPLTVENFKALTTSERGRLEMLRGHFEYGIHQFLPRRAVYFAMLREPVERVLSLYYYALLRPDHRLHQQLHDGSIGIQEIVATDIEMDNCQVRQLCGWGLGVPQGSCTREMLDVAKRNLDSFAAVGISERFDESLLLIQRALGWKTPCYTKRNVTTDRPARAEISPEDMQAIVGANLLDIELYEYSRSLFEKALAAQPGGFPEEVEEFRRMNTRRMTIPD